jgi:hypothetical protein
VETETAANPDGDVANNLMEYYLGKDPMKSDYFGALPSFLEGGKYGLRFSVRDLDPSLHYRVMYSTDLSIADPWRPIWSSRNAADLNSSTLSMQVPGIRDVEVSTTTEVPSGFMRLEIHQD